MKHSEQNPLDPSFAWRKSNPGRVLINALQRFEARVLQLMKENGYAQTRRSHINLTRHLDLEGTRITDLAKRATMTNAAMTELINQCVTLGLVERVSDPSDGRVRIVCFTPMGLEWLNTFGQAIETAHAEMANELSTESMEFLFTELATYGQATTSP